MSGDGSATLAAARASLEQACDALDLEVSNVAGGRRDDDTVMASPGLVALLLHVVAARRHVRSFEDDRRDAVDLMQ